MQGVVSHSYGVNKSFQEDEMFHEDQRSLARGCSLISTWHLEGTTVLTLIKDGM